MGRWKRGHGGEGENYSFHTKPYAVRLVNEKDEDVATYWPPESAWAFDRLAESFPVVKAEGEGFVDTVFIPVEKAQFLTKQRTAPLACVYHAAKGALKNLYGVELSKEDEDWFLGNGLLQPGGVPLPHTFRVVQGLISPYGFRVARIRVRPGLAINGNMREWRAILGMNPMALADRTTDNETYAREMGLSIKDVNALYRMEYNEEPYSAGVVCEASETSEHGHASYAAPRRKRTGNEWLSYQFSRVEHDPWVGEEPSWEYIPAEMEQALDVWAIIREEEKNKKPTLLVDAEGEPINSHVKLLSAPKGEEQKLLAFQNSGKCCLCGEEDASPAVPLGGLCWHTLWDDYKCPSESCGVLFRNHPPTFRGFSMNLGQLLAKCPKCLIDINLKADTDMAVRTSLRALSGRLTKQDREDWHLYLAMAQEVGI